MQVLPYFRIALYFLYKIEILKALKIKSSYGFHPPPPWQSTTKCLMILCGQEENIGKLVKLFYLIRLPLILYDTPTLFYQSDLISVL